MHPNLHVLLPSSSPSIALEARIYLPHAATTTSLASVLSMNSDSEPVPFELIDVGAVRGLGLKKVVTAAHPWGRLGGNMLFPVISYHLPLAVLSVSEAAIATFNVRGVGRSGGSQPWPGWGIGSDGDDFAAVERTVLGLVGDVDAYRLGYSYGTNLALNAPPPPRLRRTMLVAPAPAMFKALSVMRGPSFQQGLDAALARAQVAKSREGEERDERQLWEVYGTADEFTSASTLRALGGKRTELVHKVKIEGCGHFFVRAEDGRALREAVTEWIR